MIKVLVVEDHVMTRMGLMHALSLMKDIDIIAEAEDGEAGVELAIKNKPDVILMDIGLPKMDGIQATKAIKKAQIPSRILMFTSRDSKDDVFDSLTAGADGYIMKGANETQIENAIRAVNEGTGWLDSAIAKMVLLNVNKNLERQKRQEIQRVTDKPKEPRDVARDNVYGLTEREIEVLQLIVRGYQNLEISKILCVTPSTAKSHVHSILQKLYCKTRSQASQLAQKEGLI